MSSDPKITIYYGPLAWFKEKSEPKRPVALMDLVRERDEATRVITHRVTQHGAESDEMVELPKPKRPGHVAAQSGDYASLNDHVITNFAGWIRELNPKHLYLHNPPFHVHKQLERSFSVKTERYNYPVVTRETLVKFRDHYAEHLVGQVSAKEALLAALYPLTRQGRSKPVVVMLYGPSGVGKTESAEFINKLLIGTLMRKQFSMFHNDQFASYVFGGKLSESSFAHDLLDRESGVILIDEFDKANPVFHSAFYQLFDSGVFEDKNYSVTLGPELIICTSNYDSEQDVQRALGDALYSRFDALIRFEPLSADEIKEIIDRLVNARFESLDAEEKSHVDLDVVRDLLHSAAGRMGNVRKLSKVVEELISLMLVRAVLDGQTRSPTETEKGIEGASLRGGLRD
ncbi:AAA family ATPase [Nocardioides humi]|uniref:AAA+ ATPase domain-containing protein n=1 Tax=Nocardioides humi TaxID=449461 RepID=A0ABN2BXC1_9ACTN|nr:AAA family ATPase [Nocardioides humi]